MWKARAAEAADKSSACIVRDARRAPPIGPMESLGRLGTLEVRLAADRRHQGQGLGRALVADALRRSLAARRLIGARALLVHAIDEQAAAFYRSLGFRPSPLSASTLMLQLSEPAD